MRELEGCLKINGTDYIIAQAEFMPVNRQDFQLAGIEMIVEWHIILVPSSRSRRADYNF